MVKKVKFPAPLGKRLLGMAIHGADVLKPQLVKSAKTQTGSIERKQNQTVEKKNSSETAIRKK